MRVLMTVVLPLAILTAACDPLGSESSAQSTPRDPATDPARFACAADADCTNSCAYGAVNNAWYTRNASVLEECQDGCANQVAGTPRCEQGTCVAYFRTGVGPRSGQRRDECTRREPYRR